MINNKFKLSPRVLNLLALKNDEEILFFMKISTNPFWINEQKNARILWVGTQERIIFMDYYRFPMLPKNVNACREKDVIPISQIEVIIAHKKKYSLVPEPLITIQTASDVKYDVVFYSEKSCRTKFNELKTIISKLNTKTEFKDEI